MPVFYLSILMNRDMLYKCATPLKPGDVMRPGQQSYL